MDIRQGKIRNINRKIIAGTLVFSLTMSAVIGYNVSKYIKLERQKYVNYVGIASFDKLRECFFVQIYNDQNKTNEYYIAEKQEFFNKDGNLEGFMYLDLLEGKNIFIDRLNNDSRVVGNEQTLDKEILREEKMEEYLHDFKMVETMYSDKDIENLLEQMKQINFEEKDKSK